jgi:MYND finger
VHWERFLIPIKPSDKKFLKRIVSDQASSHLLYVAHAHLILGHWYSKLRDDLGKAFWHFTLSLEVCDTFLVSETFETKKELPTFLKPFRFRDGRVCKPSTVREYIQCVREEAEFEVDLERTLKEVTYGRIPGDCCFHCRKCKKDHDNIEILMCGRCRSHFYCSEECQLQHWNSGHKDKCRKKGEFRAGDQAKLVGNGKSLPVTVQEQVTDGFWFVPYDDKEEVVPARKLRVDTGFEVPGHKELLEEMGLRGLTWEEFGQQLEQRVENVAKKYFS